MSVASGTIKSFDKTTGDLLGEVTTTPPADVRRIVDEVAGVQPFWAELPIVERGVFLKRSAHVILDEMESISDLISREQGKVKAETYSMEILPTIDLLNWCAGPGVAVLSDEPIDYPQPFLLNRSGIYRYEPLGVVGIVSPWNYPWSIPLGEIAQALLAGNGVILKPSELTPLIAERIVETFQAAGFPDGILRVIHGRGDTGKALVESSVAKMFFTGSVEVGRQVGVACAKQLKGSVLELGGKDPQIVLSDACLPNAVSGTVWGAFSNAGQTCAGIERTYVMSDIADAFIEGVVAGARKLLVAPPLEDGAEVGPMTSDGQFKKVAALVEDAVEKGATLHCGGPVDKGSAGRFFAPAVLTNVTDDMRIMNEEIFGPVLPITVVDSEEEAIELANRGPFGLGASVWTRDRAKGELIAGLLHAGMVWINEHAYTHGACQCAWGGTGDSGIGRSHAKFGLYECVNIKLIDSGSARLKSLWWHPYDQDLIDALKAMARTLYSQGTDRIKGAKAGLKPAAGVVRRSVEDIFRRRL